jgi:hypothetical protein
LEPTCAARGRQLTVSETARLSAVVGDAVRHGRLK